MPAIVPGNNFSVWKRKRKYHSGFTPSGAGASGSAFLAISGGSRVARVTMTPSATSQIMKSR